MKPALLFLSAVLLAACGGQKPASDGVMQTGLPGMITAGGHTSGEVMAANAPAAAVHPGPSGTPGIPGGAEGNPGGAAMGSTAPKTTNLAANTNAPAGPASAPVASASAAAGPASAPAVTTAPAPPGAPGAPATAAAGAAGGQVASAPLSPASAAALEAQQAQAALERVQDVVAANWKAHAAGPGFNTAAGGMPMQGGIKSEKLGTAAASTDVKTATKPPTYPVVDRKAPDAASPKP
jgi:hypothetical protein